jgi:hypothetical protein
MVGNNENILVEFDYNNITIIDPNKVIDSENNVKDRFVKHEELIMYANLECKLLPRTKLALGVSNDDRLQTISVASINFLKQGDKEKLDNSYTDEITGKDTLKGRGVNQVEQNKIQNPNKSEDSYLRQSLLTNGKPGAVNNGLLGITSINIRQGLDFLPTIKMTLEDIKGRAMFEGGDSSPYAAFFNLPYPKFYLTIKGYYGKAVRLQLMLQSFSSRYDTSDGNFKIDLTFYTYKYTLLSEIQMTSLLAVPHMYKSRVNIETNNNTNSQFSNIEGGIVEIGYQKIRELYSEYKSKGLIDSDFPEITLLQLRNRLESFIKNALDTFTKQNLDPLTDLDTYRTNLINYRKEVYDAVAPKSWFNEYMDTKNYFVLNDEEKTKVYRYKKEYNDPQARRDAEAKLSGFIQKYNELLETNSTVGKNGEYTINNKKTKTNIPVNIVLNTIKTTLDVSKIDLKETYRQIKGIGNPTETQLEEFKSELVRDKVFNSLEIFNSNGKNENVYDYFVFEGSKNFIGLINKIEKDLQLIRNTIETKISDALNDLFKDKGDNGLGFTPTIRNVLAVIFANSEAFLRLMDDVHRNSWNVRNNNYRKEAIFNKDVANANPDNINSGEDETTPVYPWPQFIVATNGVENDEKYIIEYPGNPKYTNITKGYRFDVWPEVEFVEEFIKGLTERSNVPETPLNFNNELTQTKRISYNALEFPINNDVFFNKEKVKYFYEIFERLLVSANYNGFIRLNDKLESDTLTNIIANSENTNIVDSLSNDNPFIIKDLKELNINSSNFLSILQHMSNEGVGESWQNLIRGIFNTSYLKNITTNGSFTFISNSTLNNQLTEPLSSSSDAEKFNKFITSTNTNTLVLTDTYPFIDLNWLKNNLEDGSEISDTKSVFNTSKTLKYNDSKKIISNFDNTTTTNQIRPISNFNFKVIETPRGYQTNLKSFYEFRDPFYQLPTEGNLNYSNYEGLVSSTQTVSILNTPYFINAIQKGVESYKNNEKNPYVSAAYLFINSLPLSTLREKFKTYNDDNTQSDLNYIFATLKKFSGVHKVPYAWALKIGSEWYRYKTYIQNGNDILSDVWNNFNQVDNFDPITQSPSKEYDLDINGVNYNFVLEKNTISLNSQTQITTTTNTINTGFYPKLIDDMSYFIKGESIFGDFSDSEIQDGIDNDLTLTYVNDAVINFSNLTFNNNQTTFKNINVTPWSVILNDGSFSYLLPSNGSLINQTQNECIENNVSLKFEISNNPSMYNGSVRLFWAAPNYGYFDNSKVVKPTPEQHLKQIYSNKLNSFGTPFLGGLTPIPLNQQNFSINGNIDLYSDISEIFSVFNKDILDKFETEFLNFSKEAVDFTTNENEDLNEQTYQNFQLMVRELLKVPTTQLTTGEEFVNTIQNNQITTFTNLMNNFLNYDIAFKFGNPSNFDRKLFTTFSSNSVVDPYSWEDYVISTPNALPTPTNNTTLFDSQNTYPNEWETLQLYVGFSNISGMAYSDNGSYITDFFVDNNIAFTSQNIINLHPIIKIYASQKLINNNLNKDLFVGLMDGYLTSTNVLQNKILNNLMSILRLNLPNVSSVNNSNFKSETDGNQTKLELWETFKALNDKWIAGNDFKNKTLFEDVLLLDRASRDIGNKIFIDIYKLKNLLTNIVESGNVNVLSFIETILNDNNFVVMNIPSYVNFYNAQEVTRDAVPNPEGTLEIANTLFGTFSNVDYRDSSAKLVCFYANKPSSVIDLKNNIDYRFRNDSFDLRRISGNPLIENQENKNDYATSNKVVGFNVDVGPQNQSIFYSFRIDQSPGKATAESIEVTNQMANVYGGRTSATQNVSLYNLYKSRNYTCTISMMGNAMIQPTMYFNLRYVPMFYGPYMIQTVDHTITPGNFETIIQGTRQPTASLPKIDEYIQTLRKSLVNSLLNRSKPDKTPTQTTTTQTTSNNIIDEKNNSSNELLDQPQKVVAPYNKCESNLFVDYNRYENITPQETKSSYKNFIDIIKVNIPEDENNNKLRVTIFSLGYLMSNNSNEFKSLENNFIGIGLKKRWGGSVDGFFKKQYYCSNNGIPYVSFDTIVDNIRFLNSRWGGRMDEVQITKESISKFIILNLNPVTNQEENQKIYLNYDSNSLQNIETNVEKAIKIYNSTI